MSPFFVLPGCMGLKPKRLPPPFYGTGSSIR
jgi:hypothetical protein